jgi:hypothetical protein
MVASNPERRENEGLVPHPRRGGLAASARAKAQDHGMRVRARRQHGSAPDPLSHRYPSADSPDRTRNRILPHFAHARFPPAELCWIIDLPSAG